MSKRVITSVSYNLQFDVRDTPPACSVGFTDADNDGRETHGRVVFSDAEAVALFPAGLLDAVNAAIDAKAAKLPDMVSLAERITQADEAEQRMRAAQKAAEALEASAEAKRAEVVALDSRIAASGWTTVERAP